VILVDTSVWVDHLCQGEPRLIQALESGQVLSSDWVVGEMACGNLRNRTEVLALLQALPKAVKASDGEVLALIERRRLMGRGIGWVDAHLVASALLSGAQFWTRDRRLQAVANDLALAFDDSPTA
jgi:predicted nucleic acid-binding protein